MSDHAQPMTIRRTIRKTLKETPDGVARGDLVATVTDRGDAAPDRVQDELDALERNGFIYLVNGTVKLA